MNTAESKRVEDFLTKWLGSEGNERANYQTFFGDLCVALDVPAPPPKGSEEGDRYCFDKNIKFFGQDISRQRAMIGTVNHLHEHLGQMIAYARSNNVTPPWSR